MGEIKITNDNNKKRKRRGNNSLLIDMSFGGYGALLLRVGFVLLKSFSAVVEVSFVVVLVSVSAWLLVFAGVEFLEYLKSLLLLYIVVVDELGVVERNVGEGFAKVI